VRVEQLVLEDRVALLQVVMAEMEPPEEMGVKQYLA
jgi:hypothetical protein